MKKSSWILACLSFCLIPSLAYAVTDIDQYVDTSAGCGSNDGTIGNPYCSCDEWEAQNTNLVTADQNLTAHFTGNDTGTCTIAGWTTNGTHKIKLIGLDMESTQYNPFLTVQVDYVTVEDATLIKDGAFKNVNILKIDNSNFMLQRSIVAGGSSLSFDAGTACVVSTAAITGTNVFRNNIIYGCPKAGIDYSLAAAVDVSFYNNTIVSADTVGLQVTVDSSVGATLNVKNNVVTGSTTADYDVNAGLATYNHNNNISSDTSSPDAGGRSKTITYVDAGSNDYHIDAAETDVVDQGADLSGTGFSDDIDGDTRPAGSAWDSSADEVSSVTTTTTTSTTTSSTTSTTLPSRLRRVNRFSGGF